MTKTPAERALIAEAALHFVPPLIFRSLLNDQSFREEYGFKTKALITFVVNGVTVQRAELFDAVRSGFSGDTLSELTDMAGRRWNLMSEDRGEELPNLFLISEQQRVALPDFSVLAPEAELRIRSLEVSSSDVNLPLCAQEKWRSILEERALSDDEVDAFHSDIRDTPVHVARVVCDEIAAGDSSLASLVPNSRRYFERLIGAYDRSSSIGDYAAAVGRSFFNQLAEWRPYEGFLLSLLLSSHASLTSQICVEHLDKKMLVQAFEFIAKNGDLNSRLGAFEVGVRILPDRPEVEPFLLPLVDSIRIDDVERDTSEFKLFSALFVLVDGELARTRLLSSEPPFYRRLASLTQAALIHRQLVQCDIDGDHIAEWAINTRGGHFYMQSLADMRREPRWNPDLIAADQMRADFLGRLMIASNNFSANLAQGKLRDVVLGDGEQSLIKQCEFPHPYFPSPLEGAGDFPIALPDDLAHVIEERLDRDEVEASSFIALVNSAMIFRVTSGHAELAAKALKLGNYTLANLEDKHQLVSILIGLAKVAAVSRSRTLAEELRILVRRYRRDSQYGISVEEAMSMCLVASAALEDLMAWRSFAGEWLTELAFDDLEANEGVKLRSYLTLLLHSTPELWVSCSRAEASLQVICSD